MPEADAYELIRRLRDMEAGRDKFTPAMDLTAYARGKDRARARRGFSNARRQAGERRRTGY